MIHLIGDYYMKADNLSFIVGKPRKGMGRGCELADKRYYPTVAQAVSSTAEYALRDGIAAGSITTLKEAVEELHRMKDEIRAAIDGQKED